VKVSLADGIDVRRTAVFYQPNVQYDGPLTPLPSETGAALREHGCKLVRVLLEIEGIKDPRGFAERISTLPGKRSTDQDYFPRNRGNRYWRPVYFNDDFSLDGLHFWFVYSHEAAQDTSRAVKGDKPGVLLEWEFGTVHYGPPSSDTVNPLEYQPWVALRAAMLAGQPQGPTLRMLSFLVPQGGQWREQPPLYCHRQLIPVLRNWLALAAKAQPNQRAAALVLADLVAGRLDFCTEFEEVPHNYAFKNLDSWHQEYEVLEKELAELGIETAKPARPTGERYTRNLVDRIRKLKRTGAVDELSLVAILDADRCERSGYADADCTKFIGEAESFLARYANDEWTPSVRLMLAEAYEITVGQSDVGDSALSDAERAELERKTAEQLRAWYSSGGSERDETLVWGEIWGIEAGSGPWLLLPDELRQ